MKIQCFRFFAVILGVTISVTACSKNEEDISSTERKCLVSKISKGTKDNIIQIRLYDDESRILNIENYEEQGDLRLSSHHYNYEQDKITVLNTDFRTDYSWSSIYKLQNGLAVEMKETKAPDNLLEYERTQNWSYNNNGIAWSESISDHRFNGNYTTILSEHTIEDLNIIKSVRSLIINASLYQDTTYYMYDKTLLNKQNTGESFLGKESTNLISKIEDMDTKDVVNYSYILNDDGYIEEEIVEYPDGEIIKTFYEYTCADL